MTTTTTTRPTSVTVQTYANRATLAAFAAFLILLGCAFAAGGVGLWVAAASAFVLAVAAAGVHDVAEKSSRDSGWH